MHSENALQSSTLQDDEFLLPALQYVIRSGGEILSQAAGNERGIVVIPFRTRDALVRASQNKGRHFQYMFISHTKPDQWFLNVPTHFTVKIQKALTKTLRRYNPVTHTIVQVVCTETGANIHSVLPKHTLTRPPGFFQPIIRKNDQVISRSLARMCVTCNKNCDKPMWCKNCRVAVYCSKQCQQVNWSSHHKQWCKDYNQALHSWQAVDDNKPQDLL